MLGNGPRGPRIASSGRPRACAPNARNLCSLRAGGARTGDPRGRRPDPVDMHHHRLVLNGPPRAVAALARALVAAGAAPVPEAVPGPPRLTWTTPEPSPLSAICARHPEAAVGVERFADLGATLDHLVLRGAETTVLERLPFAPAGGDDPPLLEGLALGGEGVPLSPGALAVAAGRVAREPVRLPAAPALSAVDDALLVGAALGRVCVAAGEDPVGDEHPPAVVLAALSDLAAVALTAGAVVHDPASDGELAFERARVLAEAHAVATAERLWSRPGDADWSEWLMYVLTGAVTVVEDCAVALHQPPVPLLALHAEHGATLVERLGHATTRLVATCLQVLVLSGATTAGSGGCARN